MSAAHTPGHLTTREDALEPNRYRLDSNGNWLISLLHNGEQMHETQRENVRRLAACWNAFQHMTTEQIEATTIALQQSAAAAKRPRQLTCCVCGGSAGLFQQHWNRDTGYGICMRCVDSQTAAGADIASLYGTEGINFSAP